MIATIILGFGLLMIAAVLPLAWRSSIRLTQQTRHEIAAVAAAQFVSTRILLDPQVGSGKDLFDDCSVGGAVCPPGMLPYDPMLPPDNVPDGADQFGLNGLPGADRVSYHLLGDLDTYDFIDITNPPGDGYTSADVMFPMVHLLHAENWQANSSDASGQYLLSEFYWGQNSGETNDWRVAEAPIELEMSLQFNSQYRVGTPARIDSTNVNSVIGAPLLLLQDRLIPPLPEWLRPSDPQWQELMRSRQYALAIFHQMRGAPQPTAGTRQFNFYFATLRRGSSAFRYARQDPTSLPSYDWTPQMQSALPSPAKPQALGSRHDTLFPVAWRIPITLWESRSQGIPATAFVGVEPSDYSNYLPSVSGDPTEVVPTHPIDNRKVPVAQIFPRGAHFIDEVSGLVYRVEDRDFLDADNTVARLALDQPIKQSDLIPSNMTGAFQPQFRNRVVWVFPPAVEAGDREDGEPIRFVGLDPVINVSISPQTLSP